MHEKYCYSLARLFGSISADSNGAKPGCSSEINTLEQLVQKHLQEQKPQLAIPVLREIISLDPKNVNAQANLGVLLFFQASYDEAIPHMRAVLQSQPDLWRVQALLGIAEKLSRRFQSGRSSLIPAE